MDKLNLTYTRIENKPTQCVAKANHTLIDAINNFAVQFVHKKIINHRFSIYGASDCQVWRKPFYFVYK